MKLESIIHSIEGWFFSVAAMSICFSLIGASPAKAQRVSFEKEKEPAIVMTTAPSPVFTSGNPHCATLNASSDPAFSQITEDWELKLDFTPPSGASGPYPFTDGNGRSLGGGASPEPSNSISLVRTGNSFTWSSTRFITAVIVKGGPNANVYSYNPASKGGVPNGAGLTTPGGRYGISHISFCFETQLTPSAAPAFISGRVISTGGRGLASVNVKVTNALTGELRIGRTNVFGYYRIDDLEVGELYYVEASHKRYQFFDAFRTITLSDNLNGYDFVAAN